MIYDHNWKLNLQLMAGNLNTNVTTDGGLSVENKTFYDRTLIETAGPNLVHDQFAQKRPIPANGGKTIEFRKYAELPKALTPLTEGVTPDGQKMSVSKIEATVSQYGGYVTISDVLDMTAIDRNVVEATKAIGAQAGKSLDTITRNVLQAGTNVYYCPKSDGSQPASRALLDKTCTLTVDVVKRIVALMRGKNVPTIGGDYVCILHPYVAYDLMADPAWIEAQKYQNAQAIYTGEIGKIAGVRFVESTEAKIYSGEGCPSGLSVFGCLFFGDNAYGVTEVSGGGLKTIIKQLGSAGTADPLDQRATVGWKAMKTAERLVEAYLWRVECCSAFSPNAEAN